MELTRFHKVRTAVQSNARPGSAADLAAAQSRVEKSLVATGWFDDVEVGATDELDNLVVGMCTFPDQLSGDRVGQRLSQLWEDRLRYPYWAVHATLVDSDQVELEGATRTSSHGHYLTVHIVAQKSVPTGSGTARWWDRPVATVPSQRGPRRS